MPAPTRAEPSKAAPDRRQRIGDRLIINPKGQIVQSPGRRLWLSQQTCGCGESAANPGVGYKTPAGWICKTCGELLARELAYSYSCADDYAPPLPWTNLQTVARAVALLIDVPIRDLKEEISELIARLETAPTIVQLMDSVAPPGLAETRRLKRQRQERGLALSPQDALHQFDDCIVVYSDRASAIRDGRMLDVYDRRYVNTGDADRKPHRLQAIYTPVKPRTTAQA